MTDLKEAEVKVDKKEEEAKDPLAIPGACIELNGWPVYDRRSGYAGITEPTAHDTPPPEDTIAGPDHAVDEWVLNHLPLREEQKASLVKQLLGDLSSERGELKKAKLLEKNRHLSKTLLRTKGAGRDGVKGRRHLP